MALKVLLSDWQMEWIDGVRQTLVDAGFEVDEATDGKETQRLLSKNEYFGLVINHAVKNHSAVQVLKFIHYNCPQIKIIMTVDEEDPITEEDNYQKEFEQQYKVKDIAVKPLDGPAVLDLLEGQQTFQDMLSNIKKRDGQSDEEEIQGEDEQFSSIPIDEFFSSKDVLFDLHIKLSQGHYVKIFSSGDTFDQDRLAKYRDEKKVGLLWIRKQDRKKLVRYYGHLAGNLAKSDKLSVNVKHRIMKNMSEKFIEEAYTEGLTPSLVSQSKDLCKSMFEVIKGEQDLFKLLRDYNEIEPTAESHGFTVLLYASMLAKQFGWKSEKTVETIALTCMLHDLGRLKLDENLRNKPYEEASDEEKALIAKHPEHTVELIQGNRLVNEQMRQMIMQHHELSDGSGYPKGLKDHKIQNLSKVLIFTNGYVDMLLKYKKEHPDKCRPVDVFKVILTTEDEFKKYNAKIIEKFIRVFTEQDEFKDYSLPSRSKVVKTQF